MSRRRTRTRVLQGGQRAWPRRGHRGNRGYGRGGSAAGALSDRLAAGAGDLKEARLRAAGFAAAGCRVLARMAEAVAAVRYRWRRFGRSFTAQREAAGMASVSATSSTWRGVVQKSRMSAAGRRMREAAVCAARQDANRLSESGDAGGRGAAAAGCAPGDANATPGMDWEESWEEPAVASWASRRAMTAFVPARDMLVLCFYRFLLV